jgi:threonine/homoserine/homoserine lactone efflux protein
MTITESLSAFVFAAGLLTLTPGIDTTFVLRASTFDGPIRGAQATAGILLGCLVWGALVAFGLAALITASPLAYGVLKWAGALYLLWLGGRMLARPRATLPTAADSANGGRANWFWRGLAGNLLNPKMGVFYVSFLPQFGPRGVAVAPYILLLAAIHAALGLAWCGTLILASRPLGRAMRRPMVIKTLDRLTGVVFIGFGARLALSKA